MALEIPQGATRCISSLVVLSAWYSRPTLKWLKSTHANFCATNKSWKLQDFAASPGHLPCTIAVWGGLHLFGAHRGGHWEDHCCGQGGLRRPLSWDVISGGCFHHEATVNIRWNPIKYFLFSCYTWILSLQHGSTTVVLSFVLGLRQRLFFAEVVA